MDRLSAHTPTVPIAVPRAWHHRLGEAATRTLASADTGFARGFRLITRTVPSTRMIVGRSRQRVTSEGGQVRLLGGDDNTQLVRDISGAEHLVERREFVRSGREVPQDEESGGFHLSGPLAPWNGWPGPSRDEEIGIIQ